MAEGIDLGLVTTLQDYCREYHDELLMRFVMGGDWINRYTLLPVRNEMVLTETILTDVLQPWRANWEPKVVGKFKPRILKKRANEIPLEITTQLYRTTYLGLKMQNKIDSTEMPMEAYMLEKIAQVGNENLYLNTLFQGIHDPAGTTSFDLTDGILELIKLAIVAGEIAGTADTAIGLVHANLVTTGALTAVNAVDQLKLMWRSMSPQMQNATTEMMISPLVWGFYYDAYQADHDGNAPIIEPDGTVLLEGSMGRCRMRFEPALGNSQRVIITVPENIFIAVDDEESITPRTLEVRRGDNPKKLQIFGELGFGVNFGTMNLVVVNEQE